MPRISRKVRVSYQRAQNTPSDRKPVLPQPVSIPTGLSPLAQYIEDNKGSKITRAELIEQFQEYDCSHQKMACSVSASTFDLYTCPDCGLIERVDK